MIHTISVIVQYNINKTLKQVTVVMEIGTVGCFK